MDPRAIGIPAALHEEQLDNSDQIDFWNGETGEKWVENADLLDAMLEPFADAVLSAAALQPAENVLDIGCGAGVLTLKAARAVTPTGRATGIDVSQPLINLARQRAGNAADFHLQDASAYRPDAPADAMVSRFGVMFFSDPGPAFASLRAALKPGGRLAFACWQSLAENDWARAPLDVALPYLKEPPTPPPPGTPGPFAFADPAHIREILSGSGWTDVNITDWRGKLTLPGSTPADAARFAMKLGPVSRLLQAQDTDLAPVEADLQERLAQDVDETGRVALNAAAWIVTAKA